MFWSIKVIGGEVIALGAYWLWQVADGTVKFNNVISIGSAITAGTVIIVAGVFTIRTHVARAWKENYFAEKERADQKENDLKELHEKKEAELKEFNGKLDSEREIQRDLRHELKSQIAAQKIKIDELDRKTDLTIFRAEAAERYTNLNSALTIMAQHAEKQTELLTELLNLRREGDGQNVSSD